MSDRLENLIHDVLAGKAGEASDGAGLAAAGRRRGRRIVLRRRIVAGVAGVATVAALAVAVPFGLDALGPKHETIQPVETSTPQPSRTLPARRPT